VGEFPISDDTKLTRGPIPWELSGVAGVDANDRFCARFLLCIVDDITIEAGIIRSYMQWWTR